MLRREELGEDVLCCIYGPLRCKHRHICCRFGLPLSFNTYERDERLKAVLLLLVIRVDVWVVRFGRFGRSSLLHLQTSLVPDVD